MSGEAMRVNEASAGYRAKTEAQDVPPGYKRTEVGVIPEDWDVRPLRSCLRNAPSYGINAPAVPFDDSLPTYLRITDIGEDHKFRPSPRVSVAHPSATAFFLGEGDLVFARTGASVGKSYLYNPMDGPLVYAGFLIRITPDSQQLDPAFFAYCVQSKRYWDWVATNSIRSGQPGINGKEYGTFLVQRPDVEEQRAIAEALSDVDGLIAALDKLIAKKRAIKQAAMQQLLTGKTRLPGFSGEWETKRLGEIATIAMGRTPSRTNAAFWGRGHVWLSIADLQGKIISESKEQITDLAAASMTPIPKGTLLMSFKLSIGRLCFAGCDLFTNEAICSFTNLKANPEYLYYSLGRTDFSLYGKQAVKGYTLNSESLKAIEVLLPESKEQTAIATILSDMDAEIAALEARRDKTRAIKQGMMQQLLTGRVRLVRPEGAAVEAETTKRAGSKHNKQINEAVIISVLAKQFGTEQYPLGRMRYTKLSYLLHRHAEGRAEGYLKKAAGPYNPNTRYGGPEKIALKNGYIREQENGRYRGFVAGTNVAQAVRYFEKWYRPESLEWLEQFRYKSNEELELLATVDMAVEELRAAHRDVNVQEVKSVISGHPEWKAKLERPIFSNASIAQAIDTCRVLFES